VLEKLPRFLEIETQRRGIDLEQLVLRAQSCQWERGLNPRNKYEMKLRWGMSQ